MVRLGLLVSFIAFSVFAENQAPSQGGPAQVGQGTPGNPTVIQPFDKGFFDEKPDTRNDKIDGRYKGDETPYNAQNRAEWLAECEKYKNNPKAYRDCYESAKRRTLSGLRQKQDEVEANQGKNIKNALPMLEDMQKNPSQEDD